MLEQVTQTAKRRRFFHRQKLGKQPPLCTFKPNLSETFPMRRFPPYISLFCSLHARFHPILRSHPPNALNFVIHSLTLRKSVYSSVLRSLTARITSPLRSSSSQPSSHFWSHCEERFVCSYTCIEDATFQPLRCMGQHTYDARKTNPGRSIQLPEP